MILRKPYAFLIKHFKLIHMVLLALMSYLLYRTNIFLRFLQEYINSEQLMSGQDFSGQLFNTWMFALPFIIIVILIILLGVMFYKKKPKIFYIVNIIIMVSLLVIYNIGYDNAVLLETKLIETRSLRLLRDFYMLVVIVQGIGLVFTFIRATGFDIKKFEFGKDLEELNITEADNEEFEVDVSVETNVFKRNVNRNLRFAKYIYKENKFLISIVFLILFAATCFVIYMNLTIYNKIYEENHLFMATDVTMEVSKSYLTSVDYKNKDLVNTNLVVVELNLKANSNNDFVFNTTKAELIIDNKIYYPKSKHIEGLFDLGKVYQDTILQTEFQKILLVYEVPTISTSSSFMFRYIDDLVLEKKGINPKYIKIRLNPYKLDDNNTIEDIEVNEQVILNENVLGKTNIVINKFEIKDYFVINYNFCVSDNECYPSKQYLRPSTNTTYDKAILKVTGSFEKDSELINDRLYDLYTIINYFGSISYELDGKTKTQNIGFSRIRPSKINEENVYYIEVLKEIEKSSNVELIIRVRNNSYRYKIK